MSDMKRRNFILGVFAVPIGALASRFIPDKQNAWVYRFKYKSPTWDGTNITRNAFKEVHESDKRVMAATGQSKLEHDIITDRIDELALKLHKPIVKRRDSLREET